MRNCLKKRLLDYPLLLSLSGTSGIWEYLTPWEYLCASIISLVKEKEVHDIQISVLMKKEEKS